ncbi:MAG: hypothetical protein LBT47_03775, partial [Deltaproteobacteria bacterium]|nr:hypothetical protein [Deltaproteobacteria bacterium]
ESVYTTAYTSLRNKAGLVRDQNVVYGPITTVSNSQGVPGFAFVVGHKAPGSTIYKYDSSSSVTVVTYSGGTSTVGSPVTSW